MQSAGSHQWLLGAVDVLAQFIGDFIHDGAQVRLARAEAITK